MSVGLALSFFNSLHFFLSLSRFLSLSLSLSLSKCSALSYVHGVSLSHSSLEQGNQDPPLRRHEIDRTLAYTRTRTHTHTQTRPQFTPTSSRLLFPCVSLSLFSLSVSLLSSHVSLSLLSLFSLSVSHFSLPMCFSISFFYFCVSLSYLPMCLSLSLLSLFSLSVSLSSLLMCLSVSRSPITHSLCRFHSQKRESLPWEKQMANQCSWSYDLAVRRGLGLTEIPQLPSGHILLILQARNRHLPVY